MSRAQRLALARARIQQEERLFQQTAPIQEEPLAVPPKVIEQSRKEQSQMEQKTEEQFVPFFESQVDSKMARSRPVFLKPQDRYARLRQQLEQKVLEKQMQRQKKQEVKMQLLNVQQAAEEELNDGEEVLQLPDDDDFIEEQKQYELWKLRQLHRISRDQEEATKHQRERADVQRRKSLTDRQLVQENKALGSSQTENSEKIKYVFMQKYYHKGAFFQDDDDPVLKRDYNLPTPLEMRDLTGLPKSLQKRKGEFGKKGQSKHTHLSDVDTSRLGTRQEQQISSFYRKKQGGYKM